MYALVDVKTKGYVGDTIFSNQSDTTIVMSLEKHSSGYWLQFQY